MDDRSLLAAVATRDRDAFVELFQRFAPRVKGFLARSLPADRAEEVTQEVMLRVWRNAERYDPARASPATWIFGITRNARIDALRRGGRAEPDPHDPALAPVAPPDPDRAASQAADQAELRAALDGLPSAQLEVLERAYLRGQTLAEIADELGVPLGTVKSRVRLAMERMRITLGSDAG